MTPQHLQFAIQASAPTRLQPKGRSGPLPTGNIGGGSSTPPLFAENGVIWANGANNSMYPVAFTTLDNLAHWAFKFTNGWPQPFMLLPSGAYAELPFSFTDYPCLFAAGPAGDNYWLYACTPILAPMCMNALQTLGAEPTGNSGPACKSLGSTCNTLTASGYQTMTVAYLLLTCRSSYPDISLWTNGPQW